MVHLNSITFSEYLFIYISSILITLTILQQYSNRIFQTYTTNIQFIKYQTNKILENPFYAKFELFPYMFSLIGIFLISKLFFNPSSLFIFFGLTLILIFQYIAEYHFFLLKLAYTIETKNISIEEAIKEKEWTIKRDNFYYEENPKNTNLKEVAKAQSFFDSFSENQIPFSIFMKDNIIFKDKDNQHYEIFLDDNHLVIDKLEPSLTAYYKNFYSEFNINKKINLALIEAFFTTFVLYLSFKISF